MKRARTVAEFRALRAALPGPVGFVPTMGALHAGHAANVRRCRNECASVVASVFVNPTQFNDAADLAAYPRDVEADGRLLEKSGCHLLFAPEPDEMYPSGFATTMDAGPLATVYEGAHRPGHFAGVCIVVTKLFHIVAPQRAYFGRKDAQQLAVIRQLVRDLSFDVEIVPVETVRDPDGLALSSRNVRLSPKGRIHALGIRAGLVRAREAWVRGERNPDSVAAAARDPGLDYDYCDCVDPDSFGPPRAGGAALLIVAATVDGVRLIDNIELPA